jgi:hypothetical protein
MIEANRIRHEAARVWQVAQAERVMLAPDGMRVGDIWVLATRVNHPEANLAELGWILGVSKDAYAARLRRALERWERRNVSTVDLIDEAPASQLDIALRRLDADPGSDPAACVARFGSAM